MNTMPTHSPGPWINCNNHVDDAEGRTLFRSTRSFEELNPLDFRLAAASPELLTALQAIINDCREVLEGREPLAMELMHSIVNGRANRIMQNATEV